MVEKIKTLVFGKPKDPLDPHVFHHVSLIAFFAWVGLGADGLSSSCYGPEEAFLTLGRHAPLALFLVIAIMATVFLLSASYSQIIELFPNGGGGYLVATKLIGPIPGVISGCAILVDYVMTIAISLASSMDAIFSFLPTHFLPCKFEATLFALVVLIVLNLRGIKESVVFLTPIFITFVVAHVFVILYGLGVHSGSLPHVLTDSVQNVHSGVEEMGRWGVALILLKAFAMGGGTFTGIEAVSDGLQILREPRVATAKRTMFYMATSLSLTAGGLLLNYLLHHVEPVHGQTLNAVLVGGLTASWPPGLRHAFILITLFSEGALLVVAAQAGFIDGPRVMSNMALSSWLPRRFTNLSERLVMKDGIVMMGGAAMAVLLYTHASVRILIVMYSINVFLTFTLSQFGMVRHWLAEKSSPGRWRGLCINGLGMSVTGGILILTTLLKFKEGGWITLLVTSALIAACLAVKRHYRATGAALKRLDEILTHIPMTGRSTVPQKKPHEPTAVLMVSGFNGIGIHSMLAMQRFFPGHFKNFIFLSAGVIDTDRFKDLSELERLRTSCSADLGKYVTLANQMGFYAESYWRMGTNVIGELENLCVEVSREWDKKVYFTGQLAFEGETMWTRLMHNQTAFALQRKLIFNGLQVVILPIRIYLDATEVEDAEAASFLGPAKIAPVVKALF